MRTALHRVGPTTWSTTLRRRPYTLVWVASAGRQPSDAVLSGVSGLHPEGVTAAVLDLVRPYPATFWLDAFQTRAGPLSRAGSPAPPGYYLFNDALIVRHHAGGIHADPGSIVDYFRPAFGDVPPSDDRERWVYDDAHRANTPPPAAPPPPTIADPYVVLGVARTCTDKELKAAYREAIKANHPDRVAHLSPALQRFALEQTLLIQEAWAILKSERRL